MNTNKEPTLENIENNRHTAQLISVNKELIFQNEELKKADQHYIEYIKELEQMMSITCNKMRPPVANILGLSKLLEELKSYPEDLNLYLEYINQSASTLDEFTRELTIFILNQRQKKKQ